MANGYNSGKDYGQIAREGYALLFGAQREDAPLLDEDASDDDDSNNDEAQRHKKAARKSRFQRAYRWIWTHRLSVFIILLLIGGAIAVTVYFVYLHMTSTEPEKPATICTKPECVLAASEILNNISSRYQRIDPCSNFDKYVCEGFDELHDLRPDQGSLFTGTIMAENAQQVLRHVLESTYSTGQDLAIASEADKDIFEKLQGFYESCTDEERLKDTGSAPLLLILRQIQELYPIKGQQQTARPAFSLRTGAQQPLRNYSKSDQELSDTVTYLASIGVTSLIDVSVGADDKDPDVVVPSITAPRSPGLPSKEYYQDTKLVERYGKVIGQVLEALLKEASPGNFATSSPFICSAELVEQILNLESKLAKATPATQDAEDVTFYYNPRTLDETEKMIPQLSLHHLISNLAPSAPSPSKIIVGSPSYLETVKDVLAETKPQTLQAYFVWKTVQSYAYKIEDDALKPLKSFNNELQGKDPDATEERWRTCVNAADDGLGWILSKFFIEKAFPEAAKELGDSIVSDIKIQFIEKLKHAEWMSKEVRQLGVDKVHAIVQKIGYPLKSPDVLDASAVRAYYKSVDISPNTFFNNTLSIAQFDVSREWSALGKPTNRDEWDMTADTVNAYYNPPGNEIVFPAGIMQKPVFYAPTVPQYLSYGAFGSVSGHELSHAFDSTGRHYDETGNYTNWWDPSTVSAFQEKAQCFIDQYSDFTVSNPDGDPLNVNGRLTLGENIADAGGLNAAFKAWKAVEAKKQSQLLPGLQHFSKEQMFFISYANWWCGKIRPEKAVDLVYRDPHAPTWARILGTMANSRDFREAFSCPVKEPTCELW